MNLLDSKIGRLVTFGGLYFSEGVPGGFLMMAIATEIQRRGIEDSGMYAAFITFLALPWAWKFVMGPLVDNVHLKRFGARKQWIVTAQLIMITAFILAMIKMPDNIEIVQSDLDGLLGTIDSLLLSGVGLFAGLLFLHNSFAATQDVAIDALACQVLKKDERGIANGVMSSCSYAGYLVGGSGVLWLKGAVGSFDRASIFVILLMACITTCVVLFVREKTAAQEIADGELPAPEPGANSLRTLSSQIYDYFKTLWVSVILTRNGFLGIILSLTPIGGLALTLLLSSLIAPRLGMTDREVAALNTASVFIFFPFNILGGWLSDRFSRRLILGVCASMTILPGLWMAAQFKAAGWAHPPDQLVGGLWPRADELITSWWIAVLAFQVFFALSSGVKLALYMDIVIPKVAATQFTAMMAFTSVTNLTAQTWQGLSIDTTNGWSWPIWRLLYVDSAVGLIFLIWLCLIKLPKKDKDKNAPEAAEATD